MPSALTWHSLIHHPRGARPLIMAHRGASDELPENTLAAFERALAQGADVLETDVRFTRDDVLILMHDPTVNRTTDGAGAVATMTLEEIKKLRARKPFAREFGSEPPPTLEELLTFSDKEPPLALELKDDRFLNPNDAARLIKLLEQHHALERVVLVSFNLQRLQTCKRVAPEIPIGMITLKHPLPLYSTELWAKRLGKIVCPLDPAPEPRLRYYLWLGPPVIMTNHPAQTLAELSKIKECVT